MLFALLGALIIGLSLGLLGSGGSILTVPILVFLLQRPEKEAIAESLAIVGFIALIGAIPYALRAQVHWKSILLFGLPGILGACIGGYGAYYISGPVQLTLFAIVMLVVAGTMIFSPLSFEKSTSSQQSAWLIILEGFLVGCLTGLIGIGGGFLIVPALMIFAHLPMPFAIGTSLLIIVMNSFTGLIEQLMVLHALNLQMDWSIICIVSAVGIFGSFAGSLMGKKISQIYLRKMFGISVLAMGIYMLIRQL